jgi:Cyclopropane fatty acid synthase and related methyltransferases
MAESAAFWNNIADRYAADPIADEAAYQAKLAETRRHFRPDMELFEFGCGTGSTALVHAPYVRHIHAVDFSQRMLRSPAARPRRPGSATSPSSRATSPPWPSRRRATT